MEPLTRMIKKKPKKHKNRPAFILLALSIVISGFFISCSDDPAVTNNNNNNQGTGGFVSTPIGIPSGISVTASIGPSGGSIISADSTFELVIPPGALSSTADITLQPVENHCFNGYGDAMRFTPEGQQFSLPVTIRIRYSEEFLLSTYDKLMGIARQDASGYWHYYNDITNDTVNRIISVTTSQFGYTLDNNSGGGDVSLFDIAHIEPRSAQVRVVQSINLTVTYVAIPEEGGGDGLYYLPRPINSWYVNSDQNGNAVLGTITNIQGQTAVYKAPEVVPTPNYVMAQALINTRVNHRGQVIEQFMLQSHIKISDTLVFDLKINMVWHDYHMGIVQYRCTYYDGVDMEIKVIRGSPAITTVSNIVNRRPLVQPPSGTFPNGQGTITWAPVESDSGHTHITNVNAMVSGLQMVLSFTHTNTYYARFFCVPPPGYGNPYYIMGSPLAGLPPSLEFIVIDQTQVYTDPNTGITATLTPRH